MGKKPRKRHHTHRYRPGIHSKPVNCCLSNPSSTLGYLVHYQPLYICKTSYVFPNYRLHLKSLLLLSFSLWKCCTGTTSLYSLILSLTTNYTKLNLTDTSDH